MIVKAGGEVLPTSHGTFKRVIAASGLIPGITQIAMAEFGPGDVIEPHSHPTMWEIFLVLEGRMRYRGGDEDEVAGPGDVVMVPPGTVHSLEPVGRLLSGCSTGVSRRWTDQCFAGLNLSV